MKQEQIIKIQLMEQEVNQLNQQLQLIEQEVNDMSELNKSLDEIEKEKEIFVNIGKKIYAFVEIKDNKLIVDVGKGNFVKKNISETKKIIDNQIEKLMKGKDLILNRLEILHEEMNNLINEIESEQIEGERREKSSNNN